MRIAIIAGASSGMGREMVNLILKENKKKGFLDEIWLIARREELFKQIQMENPTERFRLFSLDLTKDLDKASFYKALQEEKPRVKVFIHSAGFGIMGKIEEIPSDELEEMVDLNVKSCVGMTGHILPYMQKGGRMIYFASASAFLPQPGFAVYAAGKAFVLSYVRSLRAETKARKLRVTAVCPGAVNTRFFDRAAQNKSLPFYKKMVMADPKKVAELAWKDNTLNREISIYGFVMKMFAILTKILPHKLFLYFMGH